MNNAYRYLEEEIQARYKRRNPELCWFYDRILSLALAILSDGIQEDIDKQLVLIDEWLKKRESENDRIEDGVLDFVNNLSLYEDIRKISPLKLKYLYERHREYKEKGIYFCATNRPDGVSIFNKQHRRVPLDKRVYLEKSIDMDSWV